jgi:hypothetical protein
MVWIYRLIVLVVLALVAMELYSERDWRKQIVAVMVLVPLTLRLLMLK